MADLISLADQVKSWAKRHEAIVKLAGELERLGSLEQAEREAEGRRSKAVEEAKATEAKLVDLKAQASVAESRIQSIMQSATESANATREQAAKDARVMKDAAEREAAEIKRSAEAVANNVIEGAHRAARVSHDEAEAARTQMVSAIAARDTAKAELAKLNAQIDEARATIKKMMGA